MRRGLFLALVLSLALPARAAEEGGPDDPGRFRVGVNLGIISIPRLINVEGYARLHPYLGVSGGWSTFPKFASDALLGWAGAKSDTTDATLNKFDAWEVALRFYPLRGPSSSGSVPGNRSSTRRCPRSSRASRLGSAARRGWRAGSSPRGSAGNGCGAAASRWGWTSAVQFVVGHSETVNIPPGTTPDVEQDIRDIVHFGSTVPLPVFRFSLGYHFG